MRIMWEELWKNSLHTKQVLLFECNDEYPEKLYRSWVNSVTVSYRIYQINSKFI